MSIFAQGVSGGSHRISSRCLSTISSRFLRFSAMGYGRRGVCSLKGFRSEGILVFFVDLRGCFLILPIQPFDKIIIPALNLLLFLTPFRHVLVLTKFYNFLKHLGVVLGYTQQNKVKISNERKRTEYLSNIIKHQKSKSSNSSATLDSTEFFKGFPSGSFP